MTWFRVDDSFYGHPKAVGLSNDSLATWTRAGEWSAWQLTDGAVPREMLPALSGDAADPEGVVRDLLHRRLWEPAAEGWQFHDWLDWNPSREAVLAKRKLAADRTRRWRERRNASPEASQNGDAPRDASQVYGDGVQAAGDASPERGVTPPRPDPTRPVGEGRTNTGEKSSSDRNAPAPDDDDEELTQVQALMVAAGRPVSREEAATIRATVLAKAGQVRNRRAFIGKVLGDPKQARGFAPGAGHAPTAAEIIAQSRHPGGPSDDPEGQAADARKRLANRERPARAPVTDESPILHGEALARAQLADARARRLPDLPPADEAQTDAEETDADADVPY
jgi:hypothetical protein